MWEHKIAINEVREIRSRVLDYFGVGAVKKIDEIMKDLSEQGVKKVICVTGRGSIRNRALGITWQRHLKSTEFLM